MIELIKTCPLCGRQYAGHSATSRTDGETMICRECGVRQALKPIINDNEEIEKIIAVLKRHKVLK